MAVASYLVLSYILAAFLIKPANTDDCGPTVVLPQILVLTLDKMEVGGRASIDLRFQTNADSVTVQWYRQARLHRKPKLSYRVVDLDRAVQTVLTKIADKYHFMGYMYNVGRRDKEATRISIFASGCYSFQVDLSVTLSPLLVGRQDPILVRTASPRVQRFKTHDYGKKASLVVEFSINDPSSMAISGLVSKWKPLVLRRRLSHQNINQAATVTVPPGAVSEIGSTKLNATARDAFSRLRFDRFSRADEGLYFTTITDTRLKRYGLDINYTLYAEVNLKKSPTAVEAVYLESCSGNYDKNTRVLKIRKGAEDCIYCTAIAGGKPEIALQRTRDNRTIWSDTILIRRGNSYWTAQFLILGNKRSISSYTCYAIKREVKKTITFTVEFKHKNNIKTKSISTTGTTIVPNNAEYAVHSGMGISSFAMYECIFLLIIFYFLTQISIIK
ncbi:uncharacterized protein LOC141902440 [Tubulanus polymorphus]|uniref:uncharacterized protein LOC141902440 n=1 Tax=Tubulanus polymorphus TaxID=672921 RepID=UPI003DA41739